MVHLGARPQHSPESPRPVALEPKTCSLVTEGWGPASEDTGGVNERAPRRIAGEGLLYAMPTGLCPSPPLECCSSAGAQISTFLPLCSFSVLRSIAPFISASLSVCLFCLLVLTHLCLGLFIHLPLSFFGLLWIFTSLSGIL